MTTRTLSGRCAGSDFAGGLWTALEVGSDIKGQLRRAAAHSGLASLHGIVPKH
jgi:hypothetical protein